MLQSNAESSSDKAEAITAVRIGLNGRCIGMCGCKEKSTKMIKSRQWLKEGQIKFGMADEF